MRLFVRVWAGILRVWLWGFLLGTVRVGGRVSSRSFWLGRLSLPVTCWGIVRLSLCFCMSLGLMC